ncbi:lysostaphin resistance A-like protein [Agreia sp.]|uniref:CPBP family intramembrane glutamic endopeptidase n=1 Tax=Agreia sp. TaxID=1872416 RepID=UPI0035BBAC49
MSNQPHTTRADPRNDPAAATRVTWPDLAVTIAIAIVLYLIGILLLLQVPQEDTVVAGLAQFAVSGLAPLGAVLLTLAVRKRKLAHFGITRVAPKWLAIAFVIGLGVVAMNIGITSLVSATTDAADVQADYQSAATSGVAGFVGAVLLGAILTPIGEEFLFRGVVFTLLTRYGVWIAVILSAAIFALSHGVNLATPVAFVVGVSAALLMNKTKSVWPGVVVHAVNNASSTIISVIYFQLS